MSVQLIADFGPDKRIVLSPYEIGDHVYLDMRVDTPDGPFSAQGRMSSADYKRLRDVAKARLAPKLAHGLQMLARRFPDVTIATLGDSSAPLIDDTTSWPPSPVERAAPQGAVGSCGFPTFWDQGGAVGRGGFAEAYYFGQRPYANISFPLMWFPAPAPLPPPWPWWTQPAPGRFMDTFNGPVFNRLDYLSSNFPFGGFRAVQNPASFRQ